MPSAAMTTTPIPRGHRPDHSLARSSIAPSTISRLSLKPTNTHAWKYRWLAWIGIGIGMPALGLAQATPPGLIPYLDANGLYGYADAQGKLVIPSRYIEARLFVEGRAAVADADYRWGYIDQRGKWMVTPRYSRASDYAHGVAVATRYIYSNLKGTSGAMIPFPSLGDTFLPWRHGNYRIVYRLTIDGTVLEQHTDNADFFASPEISTNSQLPQLPPSLKKLLHAPAYAHTLSILPPPSSHYPLYMLARDCKKNHGPGNDLYVGRCLIGFFDNKGHALTSFVYEPIVPTVDIGFLSDRLPVKRAGKWGFIDSHGIEIIACKYDRVSPFNGDYAAVIDKPRGMGFIDLQGHMVLDFGQDGPVFDDLRYLGANGYFIGHRASGWGIHDLVHQRDIVPFTYAKPDDLAIFGDGHPAQLILATHDEAKGWCVHDAQGVVGQCGYQQLREAGDGVLAVQDAKGLWGALDYRGQVLFLPRYTQAFSFHDGLAELPRKLKKLPGYRTSEPTVYMDTHGREYFAPELLAEPSSPVPSATRSEPSH